MIVIMKEKVMKTDRKTKSQIRTEKEKLVMENFASVMKKLDDTFLIESKEDSDNTINENESSDTK